MAEYKFGDGIKKFFLAGVGAVAITAEKGQEIIGELVKKALSRARNSTKTCSAASRSP